MSNGWWVSQNGRVLGPFTWEQALDFAREGWLGPDDLVMRPGSEEWVPVTEVPAFVASGMPPAAVPVEQSPALPAITRPTPAPAVRSRRPLAIAVALVLAIAGVAVGAPLAFDTGPSVGGSTGSAVATSTASVSDSELALSSGGVLFSRMRARRQQVYVTGADGSNPRPITDSELRDTHPSVSPDGSRIVFVREKKGLMLLDAGGEKQLTKDDALQPASPVWSPDASRIYYSRLDRADAGGKSYIYSMKSDGTDDRQVSPASPGADDGDYDPSISPDGSTLLFLSSRPSKDRAIAQMSVDGGKVTYVAGTIETGGPAIGGTGIGAVGHPVWSPDGKRIAFEAKSGSWFGEARTQVFVMNADGSGKAQVTNVSEGECQEPAWSPDGKLIIFATRVALGRAPFLQVVDLASGTGRALTAESDGRGDFSPSFLPKAVAIAVGSGGSGGSSGGFWSGPGNGGGFDTGGLGALAARLDRVPTWWAERLAPVSVWWSTVVKGGPLASVDSFVTWATKWTAGTPGSGSGVEFEIWTGETPGSIRQDSFQLGEYTTWTGKPYLMRTIVKNADGTREVVAVTFGLSETTWVDTIPGASIAIPRPGVSDHGPDTPDADLQNYSVQGFVVNDQYWFPGGWEKAGLRGPDIGFFTWWDLSLRPNAYERPEWPTAVAGSRDPSDFAVTCSGDSVEKGWGELNEWMFRVEGAPGSEVMVVSVVDKLQDDWAFEAYESADNEFSMTRKF